MKWTAIRISGASGADRDNIVKALIEAGAGGVHEDGDALVTTLAEGSDLAAVRGVVGECDSATLTCDDLGEVDWERAWTTQVGTQRVGRLVISPPWLADDAGDAASSIVIYPAMAFGTGEHPTTRAVLRLMHSVIRQGDTVADLGAGSAVLSIAAVRLGASRVFAVEVDPDAIGNAEENVARNDVARCVAVLEGDAALFLPLVSPVRVILANIFSSEIVSLLPAMRASLGNEGRAIISGMLIDERATMLATLNAEGWTIESEDVEGDWWSAAITPR